jgi:hypothetical protein
MNEPTTPAPRFRRVVVEGRYTYETDLDLKLGDRVLLPGSAKGGNWKGTVTALTSKYSGPCSRIVRKVLDADRFQP